MDCSSPGSFVHEIPQTRIQELPCSIPGDLSNPGIKLVSPALSGGFITTEPLELTFNWPTSASCHSGKGWIDFSHPIKEILYLFLFKVSVSISMNCLADWPPRAWTLALTYGFDLFLIHKPLTSAKRNLLAWCQALLGCSKALGLEAKSSLAREKMIAFHILKRKKWTVSMRRSREVSLYASQRCQETGSDFLLEHTQALS